jgi:hypothetical protein
MILRLCFLFLFSVTCFHSNNDDGPKSEKKTIQKKIKYTFKNTLGYDTSGYTGFLPSHKEANVSFVELGNQVIYILNTKGVDIVDLKIYDQGKNILIEIYFNQDTSKIHKIQLSPELKTLYDSFHQQKPGINILTTATPMGHIRQKAIAKMMENFLQKSRGRSQDDKITVKTNKDTLKIENYHENVPKKTITNLKFFFVTHNNGKVKYSTKVPPSLEINKLKQTLSIDEDNFAFRLIGLFMDLPIVTIMERDGEKLQDYIKSQGYNESELLDIKYIEKDHGYHCYIYIYLGKQLKIENITFSWENMDNLEVIKSLKKTTKKLKNDDDLLDIDYIPDYLDVLLKKKISQPFEIKKTINEITSPTNGYNVNFHIKVSLDTSFIENIYFINNKNVNLYKDIKSKIGGGFSEKTLKKDNELLMERLEEKVQYSVDQGISENGKIIVFTIGEPFDVNNLLSKFKPSFGINFDGINVNKTFEKNIYWNQWLLPFKMNINFNKKNKKNYVLDFKGEFNINRTLFYRLKKREKNSSQLNLIGGGTYVFKRPMALKNINKKFIGVNIGNNNHSKTKALYNYKNNLDFLYYFNDEKNNKTIKNFFVNGFNYQWKIQWDKSQWLFLDDQLSTVFILQDKINWTWDKPFINSHVNYALEIKDYFVQNSFQFLWTRNTEVPYEEKDLNIIGKKFNDNDNDQFQLGFVNFIVVGNNLYKIDIFLGYKLIIMVGLFTHTNCLMDKNYQWDYKLYSGLAISFKISLGVLNIYIPLFCAEKNGIFTEKKLIDFSLESSNSSIKNKKQKFMYQAAMPLEKNSLE